VVVVVWRIVYRENREGRTKPEEITTIIERSSFDGEKTKENKCTQLIVHENTNLSSTNKTNIQNGFAI
jgi:hypothetical protein